MSQPKLLETLFQPLLVGAIAGIGSKLLFDPPAIPLFGFNINGPIFFASVVGVSSYTSEILKNYILPYIPVTNRFAGLESMILSPAITGMTSYLVLRFGAGVEPDFLKSFALGASAQIGGTYAYQTIRSTGTK
jgi:hypothetical protein